MFGKEVSFVKKPFIKILNSEVNDGQLDFELFCDGGASWYGPFVVELAIIDSAGKQVWKYDFGEETKVTQSQNFIIKNDYIQQMKISTYALETPLGAKARIYYKDNALGSLPIGTYKFLVSEISGKEWESELMVK